MSVWKLSILALLAFLISPAQSQAQSAMLNTLHTFCSTYPCTDGTNPYGPVQLAQDGNLYGATLANGGYTTSGAIFRLSPSGALTTIYTLCTSPGDKGSNGQCIYGNLVIKAGLTLGPDNLLYGTAQVETPGNQYYYSTLVFSVDTSGNYKMIVPPGTIETNVTNPITVGSDGSLYLTDYNHLYKVTGGSMSVLYTFCSQPGCTDGGSPDSALVQAADGSLYGAAYSGGPTGGGGAIYKISPTGQYSVVYGFCSQKSMSGECLDGIGPVGLTLGLDGALYGVTSNSGDPNYIDGGTIYRVTTNGAFTLLHTFQGQDGSGPTGNLVQGSDGNFYGVTQTGGPNINFFSGNPGSGNIYVVSPLGGFQSIYNFCSQQKCADGFSPNGGLVQSNSGAFFGVTYNGPTGIGALDAGNGIAYSFTYSGSDLLSTDKLAGLHGQNCQCRGDPIDVGTGNVFEHFVDYKTTGQNPLSFERYYNSLQASTSYAITLGTKWRSNYDRYLQLRNATTVAAERPDGNVVAFYLASGIWTPVAKNDDYKLVQNGSTWTLTGPDDTIETYNTASASKATLSTITARNGYTQTLAYSAGNLASVTDTYKRVLKFGYVSGMLHSVTTPDKTTITFTYTLSGGNTLLTKATYSGTPATSVDYKYTSTAYPAGLTALIDENGKTFSSWTYDATGRGLTSEHALGADLTTIVYNDSDNTRTVTNALGVTDTYRFDSIQLSQQVREIDRAATTTTQAATRQFSYDGNGYLATETDWRGYQNNYTNDIHGQPLTIVRGENSGVSQTTNITYHPTFHLPTVIVTSGLTENLMYDAVGELKTDTLTDTTTTTVPYSTNGQTRTWTYNWTNELLTSVQDPRTDVKELTTLGYDATGALTSVMDALGHITKITSHTGGGQPLTIVDPNNVTTTRTYDTRQRLLTSAVTTAAGIDTTQWTYDKAGNLIQVTQPDGSFRAFTYDQAHRLDKVADNSAAYIMYALDALGDRKSFTEYNADASRAATRSATYDALGRLLTDTSAVTRQSWNYTYDTNGNLEYFDDPLQHYNYYQHDGLNRITQITDANYRTTQISSYDAHDRPLTVYDPNNNATNYTYDGFGDLIQVVSPDSGTTVYRYAVNGQLSQKTDGAAHVSNYTYDADDRPLKITYPADSKETVSYTYDQKTTGFTFGVGRLTSVVDASGNLTRSYDERGNVLAEKRVTGGVTLNTAYAYDAASRIASITYPSGAIATYTRNTSGEVTGIGIQSSAAAAVVPLVSGVGYLGLGEAVKSFTYGAADMAYAAAYDLDRRMTGLSDTSYGTALFSQGYKYDYADNLSSFSDKLVPANDQSFTYDPDNRLWSASATKTGATQPSVAYSWLYDNVGNRTSETAAGVQTSYNYTPNTNQLASESGGAAFTFGYTGAGNTASIAPTAGGSATLFTYNQANRMSAETVPSAVSQAYAYDWHGLMLTRTVESNPVVVNQYQYGPDGNLLEEQTAGVAQSDYVWLDGQPVAMIQVASGTVNYLVNDRLGQPRVAVKPTGSATTGTVVWTNAASPFGRQAVSGALAQNLRLPGQVADPNIGWYHNGQRDYLPGTGRYLETDPIGLAGGISTYGYGLQNPLRWTDRHGLFLDDTGGYLTGAIDGTIGSAIIGPAVVVLGVIWPSSTESQSDDTDNATVPYLPTGADSQESSRFNDPNLNQNGTTSDSSGTACSIDMHHSWPKYLGGDPDQPLTPLDRQLHQLYHEGLDDLAPRWYGTSYYQGLSPDDWSTLAGQIADYTQNFDNQYGTTLYQQMTNNGFPGP